MWAHIMEAAISFPEESLRGTANLYNTGNLNDVFIIFI